MGNVNLPQTKRLSCLSWLGYMRKPEHLQRVNTTNHSMAKRSQEKQDLQMQMDMKVNQTMQSDYIRCKMIHITFGRD